MKYVSRKKPSGRRGRDLTGDDPFFDSDAKRRRKGRAAVIDNGDIDDGFSSDDEKGSEGEEELEAVPEESAKEKKLRIAMDYLKQVRALSEKEEGKDEEEGREEREGMRDSLVAELLQKEQLEDSGRLRRSIASRVRKSDSQDGFRGLVKHRQSVTSVALSSDDSRGFSASKDGIILHWDVESGKSEKYVWPSDDVLISHHAKLVQKPVMKRSKCVLDLAVSSDGRYLATGGLDRHVHLWDTRTREHIQAFHGHKEPVSCLTFREGTSELFSGSFDRTIKVWNAEDRTYINSLFGHQNEVLTIDCLRAECPLTSGRDRTMRLFKVPDESQLVFRAPAASLECSCFINDNEFLSGSDDGSIELWSKKRKKPTHIMKNAHAPISLPNDLCKDKKEGMPDYRAEENGYSSAASCSLAHSWVSSVAVCRGSDLAASGAANGVVRLWAVDSDDKGILPLFDCSLAGYVNSLAFAKSGRFLVAGVGQEPRLGRWGRVPTARNGVSIHCFSLIEGHKKRSLRDS